MKLNMSECLRVSIYLEKIHENELNQNEKQKEINLSFDILQKLSKKEYHKCI